MKPKIPSARALRSLLPPLAVLAEDFSLLVAKRRIRMSPPRKPRVLS